MGLELLGAAVRTLIKTVGAMCVLAVAIQRGAPAWVEAAFYVVTFLFLTTFIYTLINTRRGAYRDDS